MIKTRPASEPPHKDDGFRILIDSEWPDGLARGKSAIGEWMKSLGPSAKLRDWVLRNPRKVDTFRDRYLAELARNERAAKRVAELLKEHGTITLVAAADDEIFKVAETAAAYLRAHCGSD